MKGESIRVAAGKPGAWNGIFKVLKDCTINADYYTQQSYPL